MTPAAPVWDPATGVTTWFPASEGDARRLAWLREHVGPVLRGVGAAHGEVTAHQSGQETPLPDAVNVMLVVDGVEVRGFGSWQGWWDEELTIPLFACCCPEPIGQQSEEVSLAQVSLVDGILQVEPVWRQLRPWLDGLRPQPADDESLRLVDPAQARERFIEELLLPDVRAVFAAAPALRSVTMVVAQYWNDEASDEVHVELIWSELDLPDLAAPCARWQDTLQPRDEELDAVNLPTARQPPRTAEDLLARLNPAAYAPLIPMFAAYCVEGASQDDEDLEHWRPYAVLRRGKDPADVTVEVVGVQARPWVDGLRLQQ